MGCSERCGLNESGMWMWSVECVVSFEVLVFVIEVVIL